MKKGLTLILALVPVAFIIGIIATILFLQLKHKQSTQSLPPQAEKGKEALTPQLGKVSNKIAFVDNGEVIVKDLGTNQEFKTGIPIRWQDQNATWCQGFDWSPDGSKIFAALNGGSIYDITTQSLSQLPGFPKPISTFEWNSDSSSLFFTRPEMPSNVSGTELYQLSDNSIRKISNYPMQKTNLTHALSYDGKKIVLSKNSGEKDQYGNPIRKVTILDLESGQEMMLVLPSNASQSNPFVMDISWSPDNDQIAFVYTTNIVKRPPNEFYRHIGIFSTKTKTSREFSLPNSNVRNPVFAPDGKHFIFENEAGPQELWITDTNENNAKKIADKPVDFYKSPSWLPDNNRITFSV